MSDVPLYHYQHKHKCECDPIRASLQGHLLGAGQTKGFRPLLDVFFPSLYQIFRASHNANRWCISNQMFANSLPVDARVKKYRYVALFRLIGLAP